MRTARRALLLVTLLSPAWAAAGPKVVVLGFDGADAEITRRLMDLGRLPHLAALAREGAFVPLLPTNPPQTPVSWSTFATGLNPGRTEIFDFIKKKEGAYLPTLCAFDDSVRRPFAFGARNGLVLGLIGAAVGVVPALFALAFRSRRRALFAAAIALAAAGGGGGFAFGSCLLPETVPQPINNRKGATFWEVATGAGLQCRIIRVPVTFPADRLPGLEMLSGLGVPDVRGLNGQPTVYTTRRGLSGGQFSVQVVELPEAAVSGRVDTTLDGPRNLLFPPKAGAASVAPRLNVPVAIEAAGEGRVRVTAGDRTSELAPGEWSDWHVVTFRFNVLLGAKAMARFYNQSAAGPSAYTEVLVTPVNFHPDTGSQVGWCFPGDYGQRIARGIGLFKTMGWASDTWSVSDELATERESLDDAHFTTDTFEELMRAELASPDVDLFVQVFEFTDRIQHVFWRLTDPGHPGYDAALAARWEGTIEAAYERMDAIVGEARKLAPEDAVFLVLSDHGFASFRRGVNINRWLVNHGHLVLRRDPCVGGAGGGRTLDDLFEAPGRVFGEVDWSRTRAYAMGLGNVYVNLAGREPQGIVRPGSEYDVLLGELQQGLEALVDGSTGERPVRRVYRRDDIYAGYDPELVPDLRVANARNYRVSWDTVLGGIPCEEIADNAKPWGGDHCSLDPEVVKGILVLNRRLATDDPEMKDLAPTILRALGLEPPAAMDGRSLL
jgi:predicted AlkP superfamily phosphohydrolase/phosphomutase